MFIEQPEASSAHDEEDYGLSRDQREAVKAPQTLSDYEAISARLEASFPVLDLLQSCLSTPENLINLKPQVEEAAAGGVTVRAKVTRAQKEEGTDDMVITIYRVELTDAQRKAFFLLKRLRRKKVELLEGHCYLLDRVRLGINRKGEVVLSTTQSTVLREEKDDTFTVQSLELSQRDYEEDLFDPDAEEGKREFIPREHLI